MLHFLGSRAVCIAASFKDDLGGKMPLHCIVFHRLPVRNSLCFLCSLGSWKKDFVEPGCPSIHYTAEADLELLICFPPLLPSIVITSVHHNMGSYVIIHPVQSYWAVLWAKLYETSLIYAVIDIPYSITEICSGRHPIQHHWPMFQGILRNISEPFSGRHPTQHQWAMLYDIPCRTTEQCSKISHTESLSCALRYLMQHYWTIRDIQ